MPKKALSVTLDADNVLWLKGQAAVRSVSEVLDELVHEARHGGKVGAASVRSVRGTIDLPQDDPDLTAADEWIRAYFDRSMSRPIAVKEGRAKYGASSRKTRGGRG